MKAKELRNMSIEELRAKLKSLEEELFNIKFQASLTNSPKPIKVRNIRRDIARIKTILTEKASV